MEKRAPQKELGNEVLQDAYDRLSLDFDPENGGFGTAPKISQDPTNSYFCCAIMPKLRIKNALDMVEKTLTQMRLGGIFDQLGFGFHRYSTDATMAGASL